MNAYAPLRDSPVRSYSAKLARFAQFAEPELRGIVAGLRLPPRAVVLDLGCGVGLVSALLAEAIGGSGRVIGADLSLPHLQAAKANYLGPLVQADAARMCFRPGAFDVIWSCNTLNHVDDPVGVLKSLKPLLRGSGRVVLAQSGFLPEMFFAWDAPLDEAVRRACHAYYRNRYSLEVADTAGLRGLVRLLDLAGYRRGAVRTVVIERLQPLGAADAAYFEETMFAGTWGERLKPFLDAREWDALRRYTDPESAEYCLHRRDFHHLQTLTVCEGHG
ncbi:MAG TPA: class I SAM-dependent methyltransferase [Steroidobacteraceae bacterium]